MNEQESVDAESAYGSEISSNSNFIIKKDTFKLEEPTPTNKNRCQWLKYKLREHMILEAVFFLILVFLLITCYRISSQNQETHEMILSIQSQLNSFQKQTTGEDFMDMKEQSKKINENESEKTKATREEDLKEDRMKSDVELEANSEKAHVPPTIPTVSINSTDKRFNAASLIANATIDSFLSSSSNLNPLIGCDQSDLVLVDRQEPPANKAWCTSDKNPVLTVKLAKYTKPTAVSYQHSKWNETIPDDAPKEYSVVACLDYYCINRKPIFSNCEYNQHGLQEQICNKISNYSINSPVGKLQFRFHKNHGNTERTCVSLVRVYSETEVLPEQKLRSLEDTKACLDLNHHYHHNPNIYKYFTYKNCALLYSKGCCQECPECCDECEIKDYNPDVTPHIIFGVVFYCFFAFILLFLAFFSPKARP